MKKTLILAVAIVAASALHANAAMDNPTITYGGQLMVHPGRQCQFTGTYAPPKSLVFTTVGWGGNENLSTTYAVVLNRVWFSYPYTLKLCLNQPAPSNPNYDQGDPSYAGANVNWLILAPAPASA